MIPSPYFDQFSSLRLLLTIKTTIPSSLPRHHCHHHTRNQFRYLNCHMHHYHHEPCCHQHHYCHHDMIIHQHGPLARYARLRVAHAPGMPGTFSPSSQVSDPDMHHGTCVTHVPWCMPGSLTSGFLWNRRRGETFPAFPAHAHPQFYVSGKRPMADKTTICIIYIWDEIATNLIANHQCKVGSHPMIVSWHTQPLKRKLCYIISSSCYLFIATAYLCGSGTCNITIDWHNCLFISFSLLALDIERYQSLPMGCFGTVSYRIWHTNRKTNRNICFCIAKYSQV